MRSLLTSEAIEIAEGASVPVDAVRGLIRLPAEELRERIQRMSPETDRRLQAQIEDLRDGRGSHELWMMCRHSGHYPDQFAAIGPPPIVLYGLGHQSVLKEMNDHPGVAVVGARRATAYGREVAYQFGRDLAAAGMTVVSGMALGVDGAAHRGALQIGGRSVAVLAGGPECPYPRSHAQLHRQLIDQGAVVSERPPGSRAQRWGFPARNRLIAALSLKTVVVEGRLNSGAMYTVEFAEQLGQTVAAVPGPVTSALSDGPNHIIAEQNGGFVRSARDLLDEIYGADARDVGLHAQATLPGVEDDVTESAADRPELLAELLESPLSDVFRRVRSGDGVAPVIAANLPTVPARRVITALGELELAGHIERNESGGYRLAEKPVKRGTSGRSR
ncbi:MAG: DNA-protecting protein DprA [Actinobacteria bacterium]|nr:DNA-protecting protein DprA [Actinomycetota bacterium]